jgi:hypothetical protein
MLQCYTVIWPSQIGNLNKTLVLIYSLVNVVHVIVSKRNIFHVE